MTNPRNVAILLYDNAELLDFSGPFEVFSVASRQGDPILLNVFAVAEKSPIVTHNGLSVNVDYHLQNCPPAEWLLVPGGIGSRTAIHNADLINWIRATSAAAELTMSVCTGALLLGQAGILDGLDVTTHHLALKVLREVAPRAVVCPNRRFVDNGHILTSAGITAGIDMSLHVIARVLGTSVAEATARQMEYAWNEI